MIPRPTGGHPPARLDVLLRSDSVSGTCFRFGKGVSLGVRLGQVAFCQDEMFHHLAFTEEAPLNPQRDAVKSSE